MVRVGDGENFYRSQPFKIWGVSRNYFHEAKQGDILWFITNNSGGQVISVATFESTNPRNTEDLISGTLPNKLLGWDGSHASKYEVHYSNLIDIRNCSVYTGLKGQSGVQKYKNDDKNIKEDLPLLYPNIKRFSNAININ